MRAIPFGVAMLFAGAFLGALADAAPKRFDPAALCTADETSLGLITYIDQDGGPLWPAGALRGWVVLFRDAVLEGFDPITRRADCSAELLIVRAGTKTAFSAGSVAYSIQPYADRSRMRYRINRTTARYGLAAIQAAKAAGVNIPN